jgi:multiple antibiotic resistance protein
MSNLSGQFIAVVPLAIPLIAVPAPISTTIIKMYRSNTKYHGPLVALCITMVSFAPWLVLSMAGNIGRIPGQTGINIITRLLGLILTPIAVEIMVNDPIQLSPKLAK